LPIEIERARRVREYFRGERLEDGQRFDGNLAPHGEQMGKARSGVGYDNVVSVSPKMT